MKNIIFSVSLTILFSCLSAQASDYCFVMERGDSEGATTSFQAYCSGKVVHSGRRVWSTILPQIFDKGDKTLKSLRNELLVNLASNGYVNINDISVKGTDRLDILFLAKWEDGPSPENKEVCIVDHWGDMVVGCSQGVELTSFINFLHKPTMNEVLLNNKFKKATDLYVNDHIWYSIYER